MTRYDDATEWLKRAEDHINGSDPASAEAKATVALTYAVLHVGQVIHEAAHDNWRRSP